MKYLLLILFFPAFLFAQNKQINIIPVPVSLQQHVGEFIINEQTQIEFSAQSKQLQSAANFLRNTIHEISGLNLPINKNAKQKIAACFNKRCNNWRRGISFNSFNQHDSY